MKDLDEHEQNCEKAFGLISGFYVYTLYEMSKQAGSNWDFDKPSTMDIIVTKDNAEGIYSYCKAIRSDGYSVGISRSNMAKIKAARLEAHKYLHEEANNPDTPIERKIELVKLTSKNS